MTESTAQMLFDDGLYAEVTALLRGQPLSGQSLSPHETALLGLSLLRSGQLEEAESPLHRASILGSELGQVEYGNLLRLLGRFDEAVQHFKQIQPPLLDRELTLRALRWWGVADFQDNRTDTGLQRVERAWHGYVALGEAEMIARVSQSLAQMHAVLGHTGRAKLLLREAVLALPCEPDPAPRLDALKTLLDLQLRDGDFEDAKGTLRDAHLTLNHGVSPRSAAHLRCSEAELYRLSGDYAAYAWTLETLVQDAPAEHHLRVWVVSRLAEHRSLMGLHGLALETLLGFGCVPEDWPPELRATDGVLRRRRGDAVGGLKSLTQAATAFRDAGAVPELIRVLLHQAACALELKDERGAATALQEALTHLLRLRQFHQFRPDLEELSELLRFAVLDPELSPYVEPLLDHLATLTGGPRLPEDGAMTLQVSTLGRAVVHQDGVEVAFAYANSVLLLVYLHLNPNRTRAEMQLALFPERGVREASGYVRQCIWDLRDKLGAEVIRYEGPHKSPRYRLGPLVRVDLDLTQLQRAVDRGELARAISLYRGAFLPGAEDSDWVLSRREEASLALCFEVHSQMVRYRSQGDVRRAILMANQLLKIDPLNIEVLEARVETARGHVPPSELAGYVAQLNRMLN